MLTKGIVCFFKKKIENLHKQLEGRNEKMWGEGAV